MTREHYDDVQLQRFRGVQRLAYACAKEVAQGLTPGVTEREAARRLGTLLRERGADAFFHVPFAWFGDRTGFYGFPKTSWRRPLDQLFFPRRFFPTDRALEPGMAAILDVAPIVDGVAADIGYAFSLGENAAVARAKRDLAGLRTLILDLVNAGETMRRIYHAVDRRIAALGYESAHAKYPAAVLGHKVSTVPLKSFPALRIAGFDARALLYFGEQIAASVVPRRRRAAWPLWNGSRQADAPVEPGLWAIEPHIRAHGVGAKWEELLWVSETGAAWLDDNLPHVLEQRAAA